MVFLLTLAGIAAAPFIFGAGLDVLGAGVESVREGLGIVTQLEFQEEITAQAEEERKKIEAETIKANFPGIAFIIILGLAVLAAR